MAIVNGLCALYASDHTWCLFFLMFLGPFLINQSMPPFIILMTLLLALLFTNAMDKVYRRWPRWPSGCRRITFRRSFLFCSLSCISDIAGHIATCKALHKTLCLQGMSFSNSRILSVKFCVRNICTILQQCCILSVYFCKQDVCTHSATVRGKSFLFSKFSWTWHTHHSWLYWGLLRLTPINCLYGCITPCKVQHTDA